MHLFVIFNQIHLIYHYFFVPLQSQKRNITQMKQMKLLASLMLLTALSTQAQNVQVHYDFGRNLYSETQATRPKVTVTIEQFKADKLGSWFYFVDIDLSRKFTEAAYTEISREFNLGGKGLAAHVEYDGGLNRFGSYQQAALVGAAWNGHNADYTTTYSLQALYKHNFKSYDYTTSYPSCQLTGVWSTTFLRGALTFSGFIDLWRGEKQNGHGQLVVLTEPQLWYNLNSHVSIGSEVELSNNFVYNTINDDTFFVNPTVAVKVNL